MSSAPAEPLLQASHLRLWFPVRSGALRRVKAHVHAVDDVSFQIARGETLALVGESGSGKTTVGRMLVGLLRPDAGEIKFQGETLLSQADAKNLAVRQQIQMVFQDPMTSLNPRLTVRDLVGEGLKTFGLVSSEGELEQEVRRLLALVQLDGEMVDRYPHEFSGGQRQRIGIARALAVKPSLLICDEAVSALDVSIQAQILNLLQDLKRELGVAYLFITHDLSVVRHISDRVMVMYLGQVVEEGATSDVFERPRHPYTRALLDAVPSLDRESAGERVRLQGDIPSPMRPPAGCRFHSRCPFVQAKCQAEPPPHVTPGTGEVGCHFPLAP